MAPKRPVEAPIVDGPSRATTVLPGVPMPAWALPSAAFLPVDEAAAAASVPVPVAAAVGVAVGVAAGVAVGVAVPSRAPMPEPVSVPVPVPVPDWAGVSGPESAGQFEAPDYFGTAELLATAEHFGTAELFETAEHVGTVEHVETVEHFETVKHFETVAETPSAIASTVDFLAPEPRIEVPSEAETSVFDQAPRDHSPDAVEMTQERTPSYRHPVIPGYPDSEYPPSADYWGAPLVDHEVNAMTFAPTVTAPLVAAPLVAAPLVAAPQVAAPQVTAPLVAAPIVTMPADNPAVDARAGDAAGEPVQPRRSHAAMDTKKKSRTSRRSLALIGAVGAVAITGAIAAFVWPGLLVTPEDTGPVVPISAPAPANAMGATLQTPATIGELAKLTGKLDTTLRAATTKSTVPGLTSPVSAVYGKGTTAAATVIAWHATTPLGVDSVATAFTGFQSANKTSVTGVSVVSTTGLTGQMGCGQTVIDRAPATLCFWADRGTFGSVTVLRPTDAASGALTAAQIRAAVELKG